jgi:hypothetical protein
MKLVELVTFFRNGRSFNEFCQINSLDEASEVIEIYMAKPFGIDTELAFFEIERTDGRIEHESNGEIYFNLFNFYYFIDVIEESKSLENKRLTDEELANKLLHYALFDA